MTNWKRELRDWGKTLLMTVGVALALRAVVVEAFVVPSGSMRPTIAEGIAVKRPGRLTLPIVKALVGLLPVVAFLGFLLYLDSYKLLRLKQRHPQPRVGMLPDSYTLTLHREQECPTRETFPG